MPRKVNYGFDYDDDGYDGYDEDDDYYLDDDGDDVNTEKVAHPVPNTSIWRCSICTYDNDQTFLSCDICGTIRKAPTASSVNETNKTVFGVPKDFGASLMAKSLFASSIPLPRAKLNSPIILQECKYEFQQNERHRLYGAGNVYGHFYDFQKTSSQSGKPIKIDPFKFDIPSPDDVVSSSKRSSGAKSETNHVSKPKSSSRLIPDVNSGKRSSSDMKKTTVGFTEVDKLESSSLVTNKTKSVKDNNSSVYENHLQASISGLGELKLGAESAKTKMHPKSAVSLAEYKPESWELINEGEEISRQLSLAIIGHVDSGKSTLSGMLLHLTGKVSQKEMHKYEKESREKGKGSFSYAWVMDESTGERERGVTMTVGVAHFQTKKYDVVLLDSPGHKDLVPNMISGAVQADAAVLVIDASVGSFEAGMEGNGVGQTKEHAQLVRSFGVEQIIVAVNKMDVVDYSMDRFGFVRSELEPYLKTCGFKESSVSWVPLSSIENQNLMTPASDRRLSSWFPGPHLLDAIDSLQPPVRDIQKPLCLPICDVMPSELPGLLAVYGKLEGGSVKAGCTVLVMPSGGTATVHSIVCNSLPCSVARAGDNVTVNVQGMDEDGISSGGVLCHPNFPVPVATHLELKILVFDVAVPVLVGSQVEFHMHHVKETARVVKIASAIDPKTGKITKRAPRFLLSKQSAIIEVTLDRSTCASTFSEYKALGRVSLRLSGNTVAVGIVNKIIR